MLVNVDTIDDEIFIDIFISENELDDLLHLELVTGEQTIGKQIVHVGICAPTSGDFESRDGD